MQGFARLRLFRFFFLPCALALALSGVVFGQATHEERAKSKALEMRSVPAAGIVIPRDGITAASGKVLIVNGKTYDAGTVVLPDSLAAEAARVYVAEAGDACRLSGVVADDGGPVVVPTTAAHVVPEKDTGVRNNIAVPELKLVDQSWVQQRLATTAQTIAGLSAFSGTAITSQFGVNQGIVSQTSYVSAQVAPAATAPVPAVPAVSGAPALPTGVSSSPIDVLTQQVELNAQLMMYQAAFNGFTSDNVVIGAKGKAMGVRRQVTIAIPVSVTPMGPYKGAVAEVRVVLIPKKASSGRLSVMNLLPGSNSYNVAKITTDTKQLSAGATVEAVSLGVTAGKQKSALYLAKEMDTVSVQYELPSVERDRDLSRTFGTRFRNLLPTGECASQGGLGWADLGQIKTDSDMDKAIVFGWQFRPVLGDENVRSTPRLVMAELALDGGEGGSPDAYVETRWRQYDKRTGVVGAVYRDSCTWKKAGELAPVTYGAKVLDVKTDDLGGGNVRIKVQGMFPDQTLQVRIGNVQRAIDFRSADGTSLEVVASASALLNAPNVELINAYGKTFPLVIPAKEHASCGVESVQVHEFPNADGTATIHVTVLYGKDRTKLSVDAAPIVLLGATAYGLRDHPYLDWKVTAAEAGRVQGDILLAAKTDDLKSVPALVLRDVEWTPAPVAASLVKDPTFSSLAVFGPLTGAAAPAAGADDWKSIAVGWYTLTGTNVDPVGGTNCQDSSKACLKYLNANTPTQDVEIPAKNLRVVNSSTVLLKLEEKVSPPLTLLWTDQNRTTAWSLSLKAASDVAAAKMVADPAQLQRGDSRVVHFTGGDFTAVTDVKFEGVVLTRVSVDKGDDGKITGISVLVPTAATASAGVKQLIGATATDPVVFPPVTVVIP